MAVCEAMAAGVPVVAYGLPVYGRIYGDSFVSVSQYDHAEFAASIVSLLETPGEFDEFRARGLACAGEYDWDRIAKDDAAAL